jgi:hypothetical protein
MCLKITNLNNGCVIYLLNACYVVYFPEQVSLLLEKVIMVPVDPTMQATLRVPLAFSFFFIATNETFIVQY